MGSWGNPWQELRPGGLDPRDWRCEAIKALIRGGILGHVARAQVVAAARVHGYRSGRMHGSERSAPRRQETCPFHSEAARVAWEAGYAQGCRERG